MVQYCWCQFCQYWATANFCLLSLPRLVCPASPVSLFVPQLSLKAHKQASLISPLTECRSLFKICHSTGSRLQDISLFPSSETRTRQPPWELQKSHEKHAPLWRPRVTFLSTPVLLLLGKEYLVAKLRIAIMRSLLGIKSSLAEGENLFCLLHLTPSASSNGTLALGDSGVRYPVTPPRCHETQLCYQFTQMFLFKRSFFLSWGNLEILGLWSRKWILGVSHFSAVNWHQYEGRSWLKGKQIGMHDRAGWVKWTRPSAIRSRNVGEVGRE